MAARIITEGYTRFHQLYLAVVSRCFWETPTTAASPDAGALGPIIREFVESVDEYRDWASSDFQHKTHPG